MSAPRVPADLRPVGHVVDTLIKSSSRVPGDRMDEGWLELLLENASAERLIAYRELLLTQSNEDGARIIRDADFAVQLQARLSQRSAARRNWPRSMTFPPNSRGCMTTGPCCRRSSIRRSGFWVSTLHTSVSFILRVWSSNS